jgi:hypothetical protein
MRSYVKATRTVICTIIAVSSLTISALGQTSQTPTSSKFTSDSGGFSVKVPGTPTTKNEPINSTNGPTTLHTFLVETNNGKDFYLVGYSDYETKLDTAKSLNGVISAQVDSMKGKITSDKSITLKSYPGRSVTIETDDVTFYSTVYVAGNRLYQIMFGMPKGETMPSEAKEFFSSFEILI